MDEERAAATATEHLPAFGHRRIGFITGAAEHTLSRARLEGYRSAIRAFGPTGMRR